MNTPKKSVYDRLQDLYPHLSPEELHEIEYALRRYVAVAWRVFERLERERRP